MTKERSFVPTRQTQDDQKNWEIISNFLVQLFYFIAQNGGKLKIQPLEASFISRSFSAISALSGSWIWHGLCFKLQDLINIHLGQNIRDRLNDRSRRNVMFLVVRNLDLPRRSVSFTARSMNGDIVRVH